MSETLLTCPHCASRLRPSELYELGGAWRGQCFGCGRETRIEVYPAALKGIEAGTRGEMRASEEQASCFVHGDRVAETACDGCGRFLCGACRIDMASKVYCATCLERELAGKARVPDLVVAANRYDLGAPVALLLPVALGVLFGVLVGLIDWADGSSFAHETIAPEANALATGAFFAIGAVLFLGFFLLPTGLYMAWRRRRDLHARSGMNDPRPYPPIGLPLWRPVARPAFGIARPLEYVLGLGMLPALPTMYLYWSPDHLLIARRAGTVERYERIYYADVRAARLQLGVDHLFISIVAAALTLFPGAYVASAFIGGGEFAPFSTFLTACGLLGLVLNMMRGPVCTCDVFTGVARTRLRGIARWNVGLRFLDEFGARVRAVQGPLPPLEPGAAVPVLDVTFLPSRMTQYVTR